MASSESPGSEEGCKEIYDSEFFPPPTSNFNTKSTNSDKDKHPAYAQLLHGYLHTVKYAPLSEIYTNVKEKLGEMGYQTGSAAENSIRHNLSQNAAFAKVDPKNCNNTRYVWELRDEFKDIKNMKNTAHYRQESQRQRKRSNARCKRRRSSTPKVKIGQTRKNRPSLRGNKKITQEAGLHPNKSKSPATMLSPLSPISSCTPATSSRNTPYYTPTELSDFSIIENMQHDLPGQSVTSAQRYVQDNSISRSHTPPTPLLNFMAARSPAPASIPRSTPAPVTDSPMYFPSFDPLFPSPNSVMTDPDGEGIDLSRWMHMPSTPILGTPLSLCARCSTPTPPPASPFTLPSSTPLHSRAVTPVPIPMPWSQWLSLQEAPTSSPLSAQMYHTPRSSTPLEHEYVDPALLLGGGLQDSHDEGGADTESVIDPVPFAGVGEDEIVELPLFRDE